ncbi:MAG: sugar-binding transcriptional regulator [Azospirillaceae bacterium]
MTPDADDRGRAAAPDRQAPTDRQGRRLELAARAAWLYYIGGNTQDEIAAKLNTSRQGAQRLIALAAAEGLIKFRIDHPISACFALADAVQKVYGLDYCEVVPSDPADPFALGGLAVAAAERIEAWLAQKAPLTLAVGSGRTLRASVRQVSSMDRPQHRIVSMVGTLTPQGRSSPYDVVMRLSDRVGAACFPLPMPIYADTVENRDRLISQMSVGRLFAMSAEARVAMVGVGEISWTAPVYRDGFVTESEMQELFDGGAAGEIHGRAFDAEGALIDTPLIRRALSAPLEPSTTRTTIAVAAGPGKREAIRAALVGRLVSGLITDEATAQSLLDTR